MSECFAIEEEFKKDTAHRPHVNFVADAYIARDGFFLESVLEALGREIVVGACALGSEVEGDVSVAVGRVRSVENFRKSEVHDFDDSVIAVNEIPGLQVVVADAFVAIVHVSECVPDLDDNSACFFLAHVSVGF